ncbi:MAG: alpha/beta hydrolase [Clostridia bacterium]|nr:alpha/beta hydrolase [Clostridia bacterium]
MIYKKIQLDPNDERVYLEVFVAEPVGDFVRNAILVIPGGGYCDVCYNREGEPVAQAFIPYGYNAFVLHYSVARVKTFPGQLIEASLAIKHIRDNAKEYNINPDKLFVTGFSAGGHLTASIGTMWHRKEVYDAIDMPYGYNKPNGIIPVYPVISGNKEFGHMGSFYNLLGTDTPADEQLWETSIENNVDEKSAPAFIVHTSNDELVPVMNSLVLAEAYAKAGLLFELHIYPDAPHGVSVANKIVECGCEKYNNPHIAEWVKLATEWAETV